MDLAWLAECCRADGLLLRGGFIPTAEDGVPPLSDGRQPGTVLLLGNVGSSLWPTFSASAEACDGRPHPLDRWSRRVVQAIALEIGAEPLFPFGGPPYLPFQRWAQRAEPVAPSPLGILIHPDYGLWHAYRAALALRDRLDLPQRDLTPRPCDGCADRPCLTACPVGAFDGNRYDVSVCVSHLASPPGQPCMSGGCLARRACPVGRTYAYGSDQARLHLEAFRAAHVDDGR